VRVWVGLGVGAGCIEGEVKRRRVIEIEGIRIIKRVLFGVEWL
jgi:hypothetical protein